MMSVGRVNADESALRGRQIERFRGLLGELLPANRFYLEKFTAAGVKLESIRTYSDFCQLPTTTKSELVADQLKHPPYGLNLTLTPALYTRLHQSSGTTTGRPLKWLDTFDNWQWLKKCWKTNFDLMKLVPGDRVFFPFSFGPFLGFWSAFEAAAEGGMLTLPGGGMPTTARLRFLLEHQTTIICCTPTYAVRMVEVAEEEQIDLSKSSVRALVVAGEPGGSIAATRQRIETAWGARVFDHYGMTEVGPVAAECFENPNGMHVLEEEFIAEILDPDRGCPVDPGQEGELVVTNLGRTGSPLIRYRTGDVVLQDLAACPCRRPWMRLTQGVRGRTDDMICVRGNNLYPSAIEAVIRRFPEIREFRIIVDRSGPLSDLRLEVEPVATATTSGLSDTVARAIRDELLFRVDVQVLPPGTLPRFEMKARRVLVQNESTNSN